MPFPTEGKTILQKAWCHRNEKDDSLNWNDPLPSILKNEFSKMAEFDP